MSARQLHLALFAKFGAMRAWRLPGSRIEQVGQLSFYAWQAQSAERGLFDAFFCGDSLSFDPATARTATSLHPDAVTTVASLIPLTSRIGLVATTSSTFSHPYAVARQFQTLDHLSGGRAGWNLVTSAFGEENFGAEPMPDQAVRYARAAESVEVVTRLWDSWEPDALVLDRESGVFADGGRIHRIDHHGHFFDVAGPGQMPRTPQGRPVIFQAGSSEEGRDFAARSAEAVFTAANDMEQGQVFYADMKARIAAAGRDPDLVPVMPGINPILGRSRAEADEIRARLLATVDPDTGLRMLETNLGGADLSGLDLDHPVPPERLAAPLASNRRKGRIELFRELALDRKLPLRRLVEEVVSSVGHFVVTGTPEDVADTMHRWFESGAADGFVVSPTYIPGGVDLFVDEVVPRLQAKGIYRTSYEGSTLREHLGIPAPTTTSAS